MAVCCSIFAVDLEKHRGLFLLSRLKDGTAAVKHGKQMLALLATTKRKLWVSGNRTISIHMAFVKAEQRTPFPEPQQALHHRWLHIEMNGHWVWCLMFTAMLPLA
jgi:hypothetical protein